MRVLARLLSGVAALAAASVGSGGGAEAATSGDAVDLRAHAGGWSEAARERLRAKAEHQEMRLTFTKKKALEGTILDPNVQPMQVDPNFGTNLFTKKMLDPATNLFKKKALEPATNMFTKKKAMDGSTPLIQDGLQIQQGLEGLNQPTE